MVDQLMTLLAESVLPPNRQRKDALDETRVRIIRSRPIALKSNDILQ